MSRSSPSSAGPNRRRQQPVLAGATLVLVHNCEPYEIPLDENGLPEGGHTSGTARQPLTGQKPNFVHTRTRKDGTPVQNTIYNQNGDVVAHLDPEPRAPIGMTLTDRELLPGTVPAPPYSRG